ncbi:putative trehalose-6-phosphate synthase [Colletotrichum plurivorum]|uniref:Putative trehalose-6-phosphate synthase n=1 Tax=Colletotrichum plurivorum TaxID=2175906 RepID=A0A8H6JPE9_9PEZI|nr:putative trehalose-6-phosphate synthase [Colletotrichum plurivorum]
MDQQQEKQPQGHHHPQGGSSSPDLPRHLDAAAVNPAPVNPANPVLKSIALSDAVTPGIHQHTYLDSADNSRSGSPSYFSQSDRKVAFASSDPSLSSAATPSITTHNLPQSPGSITGKDILKRMTLAAMGRRESLSRIREANPDLQLSGNIISATFNIPHSLKYRKGSDWELKPRRGQSALFDSFAYLSSNETPWDHTVVAWTGEIETPRDVISPPGTPPATTVHFSSLNTLSAPVPIDGDARLPTPPPSEGLWLPKEDQQRLESQLAHDPTIKTVPVWLSDDDEQQDDGLLLKDQSRWRRYAEHDLYTLFHYKQHEPTDGRKERLQWADYYCMNQKFANRIIELYKPGDVVIIHDYYLMLLPSMLRQRVPNMYISFFLHSPFPSSEFLRCLPRRKEVLEGVLGSNLVGFQSYSYSRHFSSCCTRVLGFPSDGGGVDAYGARVQVGVFPIGINADKCEMYAWTDAVTKKYNALKKLYEGKKIIVGRDRLDSVRGVAQKLQAFERFLEMYPEWREKVVLIQVTSPTSIEEEKEDPENRIATRVNELVMRINGMYGSLGFSPVQHYPQYLSQDEYFALLRAADIGLITSVRDGMNTTSMEYVICQREGHGPLILSEFSGTAGSLKDAITINPWDLTGVAFQINRALTMSPEARLAMQASLYNHVTTRNVQSWTDHLIRRQIQVLGTQKNVAATPLLDRALMLKTYRDAGKRLFMFDYDGTLTPIVREPSAAVPSERVLQTLKALAADEKNAVWIISGRDQEFLQQHLGHIPGLGFSAEHGSFMRNPGSDDWINLADKFDMGWQSEVFSVFQSFTDRVPGSFVERKRCALTWHYRLADPEQGIHMARECQKELETTVAKKWEVEVMAGKANLEVRPTFINKGEIAKRLVHTYNSPPATDKHPGRVEFVLCLGDDFTDEDMFRALNGLSGVEVDNEHVFTVTVGASTKVTLARWHLLEPEDVVECVALLAGVGLGGEAHEHFGQVNLAALSAVEGHIPESEK